jgi:transcriptional regulator with XRE-family HTH domain
MARAIGPDPALAAALVKLRKARRLTQEELAHRAKLTTGTLSKIETASASPAWSTVRSIAAALDMTLVELARAVERER